MKRKQKKLIEVDELGIIDNKLQPIGKRIKIPIEFFYEGSITEKQIMSNLKDMNPILIIEDELPDNQG